jgi:threonine dehydrogenase-like Zn-dependent dehydrogenase
VPYADYVAHPVPDEVDDMTAVFASDSAPTGWMGADMGEVKQGDVVAVWGAGAVGQMAAQSAMLLGAERVIVIDRFDYRLDMAAHHLGVETLNYEETDIDAELRERSDGRGPDVCIEAVGLESHTPNPTYRWEQLKQQTRILETDRPHSLRQAVMSCRKGGMVFVLGVFVGLIDKFPMGALLNKGLTMRGAQQHGERYIPMLLERMARGEFKTAHLATHPMPLSEGPRGYDLFKNKKDGCVRAVFSPDGDGRVTTR